MKKKKVFTDRKYEVLAFKRWANKNYSLFVTICKEVVISVLAVAYFISVPLTAASASQQDSSEVKMQFDIDEIEVTASRAPAVFSEIVRVLTVIESNEIDQAPVQSVQQLLEYVAAVDVRQRGAEGVQADISIRGGTFDQTIILLNGINITDPQTGHHNLNIPVSLSQIERIEVLEGPAARVYGPSAFSGAINIITRQPENSAIKLKVDAGSYRFFNSGVSGSFQTGKWNHLLATHRKSSAGYTQNTDFKISSIFYSTRMESNNSIFSFQSGASGKAFGANSFYTPRFPNQFEETGTLFSSVKWEQKSGLHLAPAIFWRRHSDKFMLFRESPPSWYSGHNYHLTNIYGANLNSWFRWAVGKTALGIEFRSENILSNVLGEQLADERKVRGVDAWYTKSKSRSTFSFFADHSIYLDRFSLSAGLMANYISDRKDDVSFFPGIDVGYDISSSVKMVGSFNTSLRMPTFTDLYYSGPTNIGNPDLKPEKSMTLEGGLKLNRNFIKGHFILFYRNGEDMIDWVKQDADELWQAKNLTQIKSSGTEVRIQVSPAKKWGRGWPENLHLNYFYNNQQKEASGYISNYVLDNLKHKFTGSVTQKVAGNIYINLRGTYQDREGTFTRFENKEPVAEIEYKPYWLFDGKVTYQSSGFEIFVSANNILNRKYYDLGNIIQPGRWLKGGVVYEFKFR